MQSPSPIERLFNSKADLDSLNDKFYKGSIKDIGDLKNNTKGIHYCDDGLEFTLDEKGQASVYMAPKSSWFDTSVKIDKITEINPKIGRKVAEEFYKKYSLGKDPYINDLLINDFTYAYRAPFLANLHTQDTLSKNNISQNFLLDGSFSKKDNIVQPLGAYGPNPFEVSSSIKSGKESRQYQSLLKDVKDSLDIGTKECPFEGSMLQKSLEKHTDISFKRKGGTFTIYGDSESDENYGTLSLMEFGPGTAVVVQDTEKALDTVKKLKGSYRKARQDCPTSEKSHFLRNIGKIEDAIVSKRYITPEQLNVVKDLPKENEKIVTKVIEHQIESYMNKVPLQKKKSMGLFERSYIPKEDLSKALEFYKGLQYSLEESKLGGRGTLENASNNVKKRANKETKDKISKMQGTNNHYAAKAISILAVTGLGIGVGGFLLNNNSSQPSKDKDSDVDGLTDWDEVHVYHTDPHKADTDGGGVNDFHEIHSYPNMDPKNPNDDHALIAKLPNVTAKMWDPQKILTDDNYIRYSQTDPLINYLAKRTQIVPSSDGKTSLLRINGLPAINSSTHEINGIYQPSYFFTHGRNGICFESAYANIAILRDMGYKAVIVYGQEPNAGAGHAWAEALINGKVYVVDYNGLFPRDNYYESQGWTINTNSSSFTYSPNWYL